jgi:hypothetical protein
MSLLKQLVAFSSVKLQILGAQVGGIGEEWRLWVSLETFGGKWIQIMTYIIQLYRIHLAVLCMFVGTSGLPCWSIPPTNDDAAWCLSTLEFGKGG